MTELDLKVLIDELQMQDVADDTTFGIFKQDDATSNAYIKANRLGLIFFACDLLKAARDAAGLSVGGIGKQFVLKQDARLIDEKSDIRIGYIELLPHNETVDNPPLPKETIFSKLLPVGCIIFFVILVIAIPIGLWTLARWVFF